MARRKHKDTEPVLNGIIDLLFLPIVLLVALFKWLGKKGR